MQHICIHPTICKSLWQLTRHLLVWLPPLPVHTVLTGRRLQNTWILSCSKWNVAHWHYFGDSINVVDVFENCTNLLNSLVLLAFYPPTQALPDWLINPIRHCLTSSWTHFGTAWPAGEPILALTDGLVITTTTLMTTTPQPQPQQQQQHRQTGTTKLACLTNTWSSCRSCPTSTLNLSTVLCSRSFSDISWSRRCRSHSIWRCCSRLRRAAWHTTSSSFNKDIYPPWLVNHMHVKSLCCSLRQLTNTKLKLFSLKNINATITSDVAQ